MLKKTLLIILCSTAVAVSQVAVSQRNVFGTPDHHYQGVLFPEAYKNLVSTRVGYPGLWIGDFNSTAGGVLPGQFSDNGWRGLYGWTDMENGPGAVGLWVGNFSFGNEQRAYYVTYDSLYLMDANEFSIRGAVWITPFRDRAFRGLSITIDMDNAFSYDGNAYMEEYDRSCVYVGLTSLVRLSDKYHLRAGIRTYNLQVTAPTRLENGKVYTDGVYAGLVDSKNRTLDLSVENSYGVSYDWEKSDTLTAALRYTEGFARNYLKHMLFVGVKAEASASFMSEIGEEIGTFRYMEYLRRLTTDGWIVRYGMTVPLILDAHIHGSWRCMLSIGPTVEYMQINYERAQNQRTYVMEIPPAFLSLRGMVGNKFDLSIAPTLSNDVFISALEVRYRF